MTTTMAIATLQRGQITRYGAHASEDADPVHHPFG
jgi:hypothetical protein